MKIVDPGHVYDLQWMDGEPRTVTDWEPNPVVVLYENRLIFVKREGEKYPGNVGAHSGTQIQEVCRALIDRLHYVNAQEHSYANDAAIGHLRAVIHVLEERAAKRHERFPLRYCGVEVELVPTCGKCGHIECTGACHP